MEEKILTEIEGKDYLLKIKEDHINELERRINRYGNYLYISFFTIFPLTVMGLLFIIEKIEQDPSLIKLFIFGILAMIAFLGLIFLFGLLIEKIKNN